MMSFGIAWSAIVALPILGIIVVTFVARSAAPLVAAAAVMSLWALGPICYAEGCNYAKRWLPDFLTATTLAGIAIAAATFIVGQFLPYPFLLLALVGIPLLAASGVFLICLRLLRKRALRVEITAIQAALLRRSKPPPSGPNLTETPAPPSPRPPE